MPIVPKIKQKFTVSGSKPAPEGFNPGVQRFKKQNSHFFFFIVCLNFKTAKFNSIDVSVSVVFRSSSRISAIISPLFCIRGFCSALSLMFEKGFDIARQFPYPHRQLPTC